VLEDGAIAYDLERAKYSISGDYNKCLLHLWSAERNTVRRVLDAELKNGTLRLAVQRLGQSRPTKLEICRERDRRSPSAKKASRTAYEPRLRRALERRFPGYTIAAWFARDKPPSRCSESTLPKPNPRSTPRSPLGSSGLQPAGNPKRENHWLKAFRSSCLLRVRR
jgi:hypothetical protein